MNELRHIMMVKFKLFAFKKVFDILQVAGNEIIHTDHIIPFFDEPVAKMGA